MLSTTSEFCAGHHRSHEVKPPIPGRETVGDVGFLVPRESSGAFLGAVDVLPICKGPLASNGNLATVSLHRPARGPEVQRQRIKLSLSHCTYIVYE